MVGLDSWHPQVGIRFENVSFAYQSRQDKKARPDAKLYLRMCMRADADVYSHVLYKL